MGLRINGGTGLPTRQPYGSLSALAELYWYELEHPTQALQSLYWYESEKYLRTQLLRRPSSKSQEKQARSEVLVGALN